VHEIATKRSLPTTMNDFYGRNYIVGWHRT